MVNFSVFVSHGAATCWSVSARLIIKDNKKRGYITQSHLYSSQPHHPVWAKTNDSGDIGGQHGRKARQTDMEQAD